GLVDSGEDRNGMGNRLAIDLFSVHGQGPGASLAGARTVVLEVKDDGVLPGCQRGLASPAELFQSEEVVGEHRLALEQVKAVSAESPAQRVDHPLGAARGDFDLRRDRKSVV